MVDAGSTQARLRVQAGSKQSRPDPESSRRARSGNNRGTKENIRKPIVFDNSIGVKVNVLHTSNEILSFMILFFLALNAQFKR